MKVKKSDIAGILTATFPEYKGRKFFVTARESITLHDLNWGDGTRNQYRAATIKGEALKGADRFNSAAPWHNAAEGAEIAIPEGGIVARHSIFSGHDCGITIYVNPANMPKVLAGKIGE